MQIENTDDLANLIKTTRKKLKITQSELALVSNLGVRFIVDLEKGKKTAQIGKILEVCNKLGLKIEIG